MNLGERLLEYRKEKKLSQEEVAEKIGVFALPYMTEGLNYNETHALMISGTLWTIATILLIYFFTAYPSEKKDKKDDLEAEILSEIEDELGSDISEAEAKIKEIKENKIIENRIIELIALLFTAIYLIVSFLTMAWHITWILWIVFAFVETIVKLIFDLKKAKNKAE